MNGVGVQAPPFVSPELTKHNDIKGSYTQNGKDSHRSSSLSLNYFEEDPSPASTPIQSTNPPALPPKLLPIDSNELKQDKPESPAVIQEKEPNSAPISPRTEEIVTEQNDTKQKEESNDEELGVPINEQYAEELKSLFTPDSFSVLKQKALDGELNHTNMRGITWRVLLGVLSPDTSLWSDQMQKHRAKFLKIKERHLIDPHENTVESEAEKFNPLSQHEENPWNQYFKNADLQREITHDVYRTYQGNAFFDKQSTRDIMTELLFLYAKEHSSTRYIQGMNELLAPILFVLNCEKMKCSESPSIFDIVNDEEYLLHDTYTLFSHLLQIVGRWFSPLRTGGSPPQSKKDALLDEKLYFGSGQADESTNLQIVQQCRHIHYNLLNEIEPHLSRYLRDLQIEPHLYMLRWVRILLTQVFCLSDILLIWDGIFAFGNNAVLLDWLIVAMLVTIKHLLLGQDYSRCMQLLFNYPQDKDVRILVTSAQKLYVKFQQQRQISQAPATKTATVKSPPTTNTVTTRPSSAPVSATPVAAMSTSAPKSITNSSKSPPPLPPKNSPPSQRGPALNNAPQYPQAFQQPLPQPPQPAPSQAANVAKQKSILQFIFAEGSADSSAAAPTNANANTNATVNATAPTTALTTATAPTFETQHLRNTCAHMANRLERVIFLLSSLPSSPENEETVKLATEEVAQIKAVLNEASESVESTENKQDILDNNNTQQQDNAQQPNVYEKILSTDPLKLFRRK